MVSKIFVILGYAFAAFCIAFRLEFGLVPFKDSKIFVISVLPSEMKEKGMELGCGIRRLGGKLDLVFFFFFGSQAIHFTIPECKKPKGYKDFITKYRKEPKLPKP